MTHSITLSDTVQKCKHGPQDQQGIVTSGVYPNLAAGTAIEIGGDSTQTVYEREVLPIMQQQTDLWPADVRTLEAFEHYAGLVQSRAFHMLTENWITGSAQEGISSTKQCNMTYVLHSSCHCHSDSRPMWEALLLQLSMA